jgi:hypothetical protein
VKKLRVKKVRAEILRVSKFRLIFIRRLIEATTHR